MHHKGRLDFHKQLIGLQKEQGKLEELLSVARPSLDKKDLVSRLRDVRGEIACIELQVHAKS